MDRVANQTAYMKQAVIVLATNCKRTRRRTVSDCAEAAVGVSSVPPPTTNAKRPLPRAAISEQKEWARCVVAQQRVCSGPSHINAISSSPSLISSGDFTFDGVLETGNHENFRDKLSTAGVITGGVAVCGSLFFGIEDSMILCGGE